ncbi:MAG TPA: glycoside hydrolase family 30 beta sandwich domain-containing protein [Solirubrobacteraceae bacterium]
MIDTDSSSRYQRMLGFGGAMTDSSAWLLHDELTSKQEASTMKALFSSSGIDLNYVRIPIGASDYVADADPYSYDDLPRGHTDPALAHFSIAHDKRYILPALREMLAVNRNVYTLANPWSAPPWMKSNDVFDNKRWQGSVLPKFYSSLADYFVKFIDAYKGQGVPIDAITPMNEPQSPSRWPGTHLTADDDAKFLPDDLTPALSDAGLHPAIYGPDQGQLEDAKKLFTGPAAKRLSGAAFHCYHGTMAKMSTFHDQFPHAPILVNECSPGIIPYATAEVPIDAARNWASGVQLWNLALDPDGGPVENNKSYGCPRCTGIVTVNKATHSTTYNLNYYQLGQTSKYVQLGAVRISSTRFVHDLVAGGVSPGVDDVGYLNPDGSKVLVAYNSGRSPASFAVHWRSRFLNWTLAPAATATLVWR